MNWDDNLSLGLARVRGKSRGMSQDAAFGLKVVLADSTERVPKESGDLAASAKILSNRGGRNTAAIVYASVYARWIHEHLWFKHPRGGQAKYLETAMITKGQEAINAAGEHLWRRL